MDRSRNLLSQKGVWPEELFVKPVRMSNRDERPKPSSRSNKESASRRPEKSQQRTDRKYDHRDRDWNGHEKTFPKKSGHSSYSAFSRRDRVRSDSGRSSSGSESHDLQVIDGVKRNANNMGNLFSCFGLDEANFEKRRVEQQGYRQKERHDSGIGSASDSNMPPPRKEFRRDDLAITGGGIMISSSDQLTTAPALCSAGNNEPLPDFIEIDRAPRTFGSMDDKRKRQHKRRKEDRSSRKIAVRDQLVERERHRYLDRLDKQKEADLDRWSEKHDETRRFERVDVNWQVEQHLRNWN